MIALRVALAPLLHQACLATHPNSCFRVEKSILLYHSLDRFRAHLDLVWRCHHQDGPGIIYHEFYWTAH
jgi:hypothetical protein